MDKKIIKQKLKGVKIHSCYLFNKINIVFRFYTQIKCNVTKTMDEKTDALNQNLKQTQKDSLANQKLRFALIACKNDLLNTASLALITIQIWDMYKGLFWCTSHPSQLPSQQHIEYPFESQNEYVYKAPIFDLKTHYIYGEVILFNCFKQENIFGQLAATQCAEMIVQKINQEPIQCLSIQAYSNQYEIKINHQPVLLTPRQFEIICILILNPMGLSLEQLHLYLYEDENISLNTLKSEISYLKNKVGELICARTYQIQAEVFADFKLLEEALDAGYLDTIRELDQGDYFTKCKSPFLRKWQQILRIRIQNLLG